METLTRQLVIDTIKNLPVLADTIESADDFVNVWTLLEFIKDRAKEFQAKMEENGIRYMQGAGIREIVLSAEAKIILAQKKKEVYDTEAIYKALAFTPPQIAVLPKNPAWRKTAILENSDTAGAWSQNVYDDLEVKKINPAMIAAKKG